MKRYVTCVNDEVAAKFDKFCAEKKQTPYDFLSFVIHKMVGAERKKHGATQAKEVEVEVEVEVTVQPPAPVIAAKPDFVAGAQRALQQNAETFNRFPARAPVPNVVISCSACGGASCNSYCAQDETKKNMNSARWKEG
jgi:hypothetical protein